MKKDVSINDELKDIQEFINRGGLSGELTQDIVNLRFINIEVQQKWDKAMRKLQDMNNEILTEKLKLEYPNPYNEDMDSECIDLCNAMNALPNISTMESCCGHNESEFKIFFKCDNMDQKGLYFLSRSIDSRYFSYGNDCVIETSITDMNRSVVFILRIKSTNLSRNLMISDAIIKSLNEHLNHRRFMESFEYNINAFSTNRNVKLMGELEELFSLIN